MLADPEQIPADTAAFLNAAVSRAAIDAFLAGEDANQPNDNFASVLPGVDQPQVEVFEVGHVAGCQRKASSRNGTIRLERRSGSSSS